MERMANAILFCCGESFSEPVLYLNLFSMLQRVKNYLECVLVSIEELVQQEHLLRMIVNNYKFVFSVEMGKSLSR